MSTEYITIAVSVGSSLLIFAYGYGKLTQKISEIENRHLTLNLEFAKWREEIKDDLKELNLNINHIALKAAEQNGKLDSILTEVKVRARGA